MSSEVTKNSGSLEFFQGFALSEKGEKSVPFLDVKKGSYYSNSNYYSILFSQYEQKESGSYMLEVTAKGLAAVAIASFNSSNERDLSVTKKMEKNEKGEETLVLFKIQIPNSRNNEETTKVLRHLESSCGFDFTFIPTISQFIQETPVAPVAIDPQMKERNKLLKGLENRTISTKTQQLIEDLCKLRPTREINLIMSSAIMGLYCAPDRHDPEDGKKLLVSHLKKLNLVELATSASQNKYTD